jgi:hypothetical protein
MRIRIVLLTAAAALAVVYLLRMAGGPEISDEPAERARVARASRGDARPAAEASAPLRNVFEYGEGTVRAAAPPRAAIAAPPVPTIIQPVPSPSPLVRLVGLLRRGGRTRAALAIAGETIDPAAGESASGYTVVSIDDDEGVRVGTPDGSTLVLAASPDQ